MFIGNKYLSQFLHAFEKNWNSFGMDINPEKCVKWFIIKYQNTHVN